MLDTANRVSDEAKVEALESEQPSAEATEPIEPEATAGASKSSELLSPELLSLLRKALPVVWLVATVLAGLMSGPPLVCLVLATGALVLVLVLMWSSVQSLTGGAALGFEEALGMGAPSRVEEEKRAVLRALKDLEYERGVGKISPEDYAELSARYRADAKRLMQSLDAALGPARDEVERAIQERLARVGITPPAAEPEPDTTPSRDSSEPAPTSPKPEKTAENPAETPPQPPEKTS
jgi:hypothetical protein